ncbi:MAG: SDR family oxidoreductase [Rhodobacteraceae bacterium]|jgi:NAD(P)-dependent dehydrogenase (short-subunit alcohol dehydrogenase family)|nr:SDR family oxidoreductase [Paracoccaceae bacterium]
MAEACHRLPGRVLVTGAAGGIGGAIVARLAAAGVEVVATDLHIPPGPPPGRWVEADLVTDAGRAAVAAAVPGDLGGIVHAAGLLDPKPWDAVGAEAALRILAVNVVAPLLLVQALAGRMEPGGAVVFLGSVAGARAAPDTAVYAASKAALRNLAGTLAVALAPRGVRVNTLAPGLIDTPLTTGLDHRLAAARGQTPEAVAAARAAAVPAGRAGTAGEVADACLWLLGTGASYVSGATLYATGGALAGAI